jgi:hypothetical protein
MINEIWLVLCFVKQANKCQPGYLPLVSEEAQQLVRNVSKEARDSEKIQTWHTRDLVRE